MILIEIKIEARYLKMNSQTPQEKTDQKPRAFQLNGTLHLLKLSQALKKKD